MVRHVEVNKSPESWYCNEMLDCHRCYFNFPQNSIHSERWFHARASFSTEFNKARNDYHLLTYFSLLAPTTTPLSAGNRLLASLYTFTVIHEVSHPSISHLTLISSISDRKLSPIVSNAKRNLSENRRIKSIFKNLSS